MLNVKYFHNNVKFILFQMEENPVHFVDGNLTLPVW